MFTDHLRGSPFVAEDTWAQFSPVWGHWDVRHSWCRYRWFCSGTAGSVWGLCSRAKLVCTMMYQHNSMLSYNQDFCWTRVHFCVYINNRYVFIKLSVSFLRNNLTTNKKTKNKKYNKIKPNLLASQTMFAKLYISKLSHLIQHFHEYEICSHQQVAVIQSRKKEKKIRAFKFMFRSLSDSPCSWYM